MTPSRSASSGTEAGLAPPLDLAALTVRPTRRPGFWLAGGVCLAALILVVYILVTNDRFRWPVVFEFLFDPRILAGLGLTLFLTLCCMIGSFLLGTVLAVMDSSHNPFIRGMAQTYLWVFRGTPVLVQLLLWFNLGALFPVIGIPGTVFAWSANALISPLSAAIIGLTLNESAYMAEIIRSGLNSVDAGQREAAQALGMRGTLSFRRVVLPQAMRVIVPPTGNETISMLKYTSLVSVIALPELLYSAQLIASKNFQIIPMLLVATIWYLATTSVLSILQRRIEIRFGRGVARTAAQAKPTRARTA